jgi:hypothetical protein
MDIGKEALIVIPGILGIAFVLIVSLEVRNLFCSLANWEGKHRSGR